MNHLPLQRLGGALVFLLFCCASPRAQEQNDFHRNWIPGDFMHVRHADPCKVFIGVGTSNTPDGLKVDYTIDNTPARTYGVLAGDLILALDGVPVKTQPELERERDKHQEGEAFALTILRNGSEMTVNARFKECTEAEREQARERQEALEMRMEALEERMMDMRARMAERFAAAEAEERPILGVYENRDVSVPGLVIGSAITGKGAEAAGLKAGDVVIRVDDKTVTGGGTLRGALAGHRPGDRVAVVYQRNDQTLQTEVVLSADRNYFKIKSERDPCAVFIGVYTADADAVSRGVRVTGIVDDTPAKESGVQPGDVILALDDQPVNTHVELLRERNKHKPGDAFLLTVLRDGAELNIGAQFKSCPTEKTTETPVADTPPAERENAAAPSLETLELYPNPTAGPLNVRFEAEAVPTTVRIMDTAGKTVYHNAMKQFGGSFSERINLEGNTPGTYILTVEQNGKMQSKKIVLLPRA